MLLVHFDLILLINNDMMHYVMWYCSYEVAFVDVMQTWTILFDNIGQILLNRQSTRQLPVSVLQESGNLIRTIMCAQLSLK